MYYETGHTVGLRQRVAGLKTATKMDVRVVTAIYSSIVMMLMQLNRSFIIPCLKRLRLLGSVVNGITKRS